MPSPAPTFSFQTVHSRPVKNRAAIGLSAVPSPDFDVFTPTESKPAYSSWLSLDTRLLVLACFLMASVVLAIFSWLPSPMPKQLPQNQNHVFGSERNGALFSDFSDFSEDDTESVFDFQALEDEPKGDINKDKPTSLPAIGRADPFSPIRPVLIEEAPTAAEDLMPSEEDLIEFVGIITGQTAKDSVAIVHLMNDPTNSTQLVEAGHTFKVNGETVKVVKITKNTLHVRIKGANKVINLKEYVDAISTDTEENQNSLPENVGQFVPSGGPRQFMNQR